MLLLFFCSALVAYGVGVDGTNKYAWGENIGWLNWGTPEGAVDAPLGSGDLTGYVWGENVGWISLNCSNTSSCGTVGYGVTRTGANLSGYAWGENIGWISFSCSNTSSCGTVSYGVTVDIATSVFSGYAWGENIGWISLNCSNTSSCGTVDYKVVLGATPTPTPAVGGGFIPTPTPTSPPPGTGAIWINDYADTTNNRIVRLGLFQPFGGSGSDVTVVLLNEQEASAQDRAIIAGTARGTAPAQGPGLVRDTAQIGPQAQEFSGGVRRQFAPTVATWDLCPKGQPCPGGPYRVFAQFTKPTTSGVMVQTVLAAIGDQVSGPYGDSISLTTTPTITPPPGTPTPTPPPFPTPPSTPPPATPPVGPPSVTPPADPVSDTIEGISDFIDGITGLLFGPLENLCEGPLGITACGTTAMAVVAVAAALVAAIIQNELAAALFSLLQIVGIHKKARVWGVVYDSSTKHPVPAAKIELLDASGRVLEVRFTDRDGRYGFLTTPASLSQQELKASIRVTKPGYRFPSSLVASGTDYVVYENMYRGGEFTIVGDGLLNFSIPMDPLSGARVRLSGFGRALFGTIGERLLAFGFIVGVIAVPVNYYFAPTTKNLIILIVFFVVNGLRLALMYRPYGVTVDALTGKKLPFALVTLLDETGKRVGFAVSDEHGRYVLSAQRGPQYEAVAYTPANTVPQRTVRQKISRLSRIGRTAWVTLTLRI